MQTRSATKVPALKSVTTNSHEANENKSKITSTKKPYGFISFINEVNFKIVKSLKCSKNPIKRIKINTSKSIRDYLIRNYKLNYSFQKVDFVENYQIIKERYYTNCTKNRISIKSNSFEIKLNKHSSVKFMNAKGEYEKLKDKLSITIKFIKESYVQLTEKQREILDARRAKFFK